MLEDDFVVDDNGAGYANGLENWDEHLSNSDSDSDILPENQKRKLKKKKKSGPITALFNNQAKKVAEKKIIKELEPDQNDKEFLQSLLVDFDENLSELDHQRHVKKPTKIHSNHFPLDKFFRAPINKEEKENTPNAEINFHHDNDVDMGEQYHEPEPSTKLEFPNETNSQHTTMNKYQSKINTTEIMPSIKLPELKIKSIQSSKSVKDMSKFLPKYEKIEKTLAVPTIVSTTPSNNQKWKDIQDNLSITTQEIQPETTANDIETDIPVTIGDVYQEIEKIRRQYNIKQIKTKQVNRQYAFELPNIPTESDYLKVLYPFTEPALNANTTGRTFSKIFGTQTNALELFLLKRKLMGPCWLRINNPQISTKNISWCQLEILLTTPKNIVLLDTKIDTNVPTKTPPLVVMSLNLRTAMNPIKNVNEIVACSALVYTNGNELVLMMIVNMDMDSSDLVGVRFTAVRQLTDVPWPMGFVDATRKLKTKVELPPNERALLSFLLAKIYQLDPDIIVGHNFIDFDLDVLLQRMKANRVDHWSRLGRLRRTVWPKMQSGAGGTGDSSFAEKQIVSGRLICDTFRAAKDFLNSKSNSLTYLSSTQLKIERCDIEYDKILSYFWDTQALIEMIQHCECDVYLVTQLMFKLQVIPLTKQLTTLAELNDRSRTMMGARSERNEFLLLHEFHSRKFICPDKHIYTNQPEGDDDEVVVPKKGRRKAAYAGGLVLEPKKGLYDKFVVMLDFNSLYPSIIQEFNICFTTVERTYDDLGDHMPDVPDCDAPAGVLPKVLKTLVDRRKAVKGLLKNPKNTPSQYAMYDIRQKALKLTANSMYGCLGFVHSRFFAKPLAMLITSKGREILQSTVQIAEESQLEVIYGDTDSIMINTNTLDIEQVKEIAKKLKTEVNKKYKILEIEMDGMYKRMLLLKKKKYAAVVMTEKNGEWVSAIETKGLDIVRRDWCDLSHDTSNFVLGQIFSAANCEDTVNRIHEYLGKVGEEVRAGLIPPTKFGLTKRPEEYADKNTQPHVQVALRLISQGLGAKVGDTIPYVICRGTESVIAQRAYHIDELTKVDSGLELDLEWYLANQIHPPIARLCAPIEGTDNARLAVCLGN
ncbi:DNA polymerase alpha catalytic subunit [Globomyces sp. JEL0801]|nr:DNA polymerase alpha catalytic subunit [Globomyces sp. JEL0801]